MKYPALALILFSSLTYADYQFYCVGNNGRVALSAHTKNGEFIVRYSNALGAQDFPFYEGTVTQVSLPFIKNAQAELSALDHEVIVKWPEDKCEIDKERPLLFRCGGEGKFLQLEHAHLKSYSLSTAMVTETNLYQSYEIFKIRWSIEGSTNLHSLALPFDPKNCTANLSSP